MEISIDFNKGTQKCLTPELRSVADKRPTLFQSEKYQRNQKTREGSFSATASSS